MINHLERNFLEDITYNHYASLLIKKRSEPFGTTCSYCSQARGKDQWRKGMKETEKHTQVNGDRAQGRRRSSSASDNGQTLKMRGTEPPLWAGRRCEIHWWTHTHLGLQSLPFSGIFQLLNSQFNLLDFLVNCGYSLIDSSSFFLNFVAISKGKQRQLNFNSTLASEKENINSDTDSEAIASICLTNLNPFSRQKSKWMQTPCGAAPEGSHSTRRLEVTLPQVSSLLCYGWGCESVQLFCKADWPQMQNPPVLPFFFIRMRKNEGNHHHTQAETQILWAYVRCVL